MPKPPFDGYRKIRAGKKRAEASSLIACRNPLVLEAHGFDRGFWASLDEGPVEDAIVLVGHKRDRRPHKGWKTKRLDLVPAEDCRGITDDSESLARHGDHLYVIGSHFGAKSGPLEESRAFIARFDESRIEGKPKAARLPLQVLRRPFQLHRAINDALAAARFELLPLGTHVRQRFIEATLERGFEARCDWSGDVRVEDWPLNIEGAVFLEDHSALLGLRFPTTAKGQPILVRVTGIVESFDHPDAAWEVADVGWIANVGERGAAAGLRDLDLAEGALHLLSGPIGSVFQPNAVAMDYPGSARRACLHHAVDLPGELGALRARQVRDLGTHGIEGNALGPDQRWYYAFDSQDAVRIAVPVA